MVMYLNPSKSLGILIPNGKSLVDFFTSYVPKKDTSLKEPVDPFLKTIGCSIAAEKAL